MVVDVKELCERVEEEPAGPKTSVPGAGRTTSEVTGCTGSILVVPGPGMEANCE